MDQRQLAQFIADHFNLDELQQLCLDLTIKFDELGGQGLTNRAQKLVRYCERRGSL